MSMGVIVIAIIVIVVIGVGAAVTLRREPDDAGPEDVGPEDVGKDDVSESATHGSDNPQWPEAQTREPWPPSPSPVAPMPAAPAPQELTTQGSEIRSDPDVRRSPNAESVTRLWNDGTINGYQDRWGKVQAQFIDDPQNAAVAAEALITDVIESLAATISAQKSTLDAWRSSNGADTEELRMVVRRYRDFLDRVLGA